MNIENRVIFYLVFFIVMQVITLLSRKILWNSVCKAGGTTPEGVREKEASFCNNLQADKTCKTVFVRG